MRRVFVFVVLWALFISPLHAVTCGNGYYAENDICTKCPDTYPLSATGATNINECYLITSPGKYVQTPMMGEINCAKNNFCRGGFKIFNDIYIQLEYLESTGTQWIDTEFSDTEMRLVFNAMWPTQSASSGYSYIFGVHNAMPPYERNGVTYNYNRNCLETGYGNYFVCIYPEFQFDTFYTIDHSTLGGKCTVYIDDELKYTNNSKQTLSQNTLKIFRTDYPSTNYARGKIKYAQIYDHNNTLVRDFIPVYNYQTKKYGMYDKVHDKFYYNNGTGEFIGGPFVARHIVTGGNTSCAGATNGIAPFSPAGSDDVTDCGRILHLGNDVLYLRSAKRTTPALHVKIGNKVFYGDMESNVNRGHLRTRIGETPYSIFNADVD